MVFSAAETKSSIFIFLDTHQFNQILVAVIIEVRPLSAMSVRLRIAIPYTIDNIDKCAVLLV